MQVRDPMSYDWVPFPILLRDVPTVVPIVTCVNGKWGVEYAMIRATVESVVVLPFDYAEGRSE